MLSTPPFAPKVAQWLADLGIAHADDVRQINPCRAFLLLKQHANGITQTVFWQLVALVEGCSVAQLSPQQRVFWQTQLRDCPPVAVFPPRDEMNYFMQFALQQAAQAAKLGEIPVGAIVVHRGNIIAQAHNSCVSQHNVSHHAEILALAQAGQVLQNYRLNDCDVYVSLEPCAMCASAILQARIRRLIFAAPEPKTGAAGSVLDLFAMKNWNAHTAVLGGVLADESRQLLQDFFQSKR
ncbi:tRNA adenosine(34) deaminase TadA [Alysiella filiformis]|uniref:tRNA-specific adenosine deaminase n=1 Tax=Alysiella filiformis DSM 16848 TaxID=1120981 RepID=A0A286EBE2_9NEIS|nr:tRNA adenosine(34) deaminase TadA [Alysiella filiformis]QMT31266.1 tRNA-specific adenosine deaminase [Alysiella filiformis]UBQ55732.1 tRNA adenosine(34) deaminase TadA [Alysiella filiformis DSM 16848]SOD68232.1 cytosine deaminase [Alysiella filiformis DSM 16848]